MVSKLIFIIPLFLGLFIYNPKITLIAGFLFFFLYVIIFFSSQKKFDYLGQNQLILLKKL